MGYSGKEWESMKAAYQNWKEENAFYAIDTKKMESIKRCLEIVRETSGESEDDAEIKLDHDADNDLRFWNIEIRAYVLSLHKTEMEKLQPVFNLANDISVYSTDDGRVCVTIGFRDVAIRKAKK